MTPETRELIDSWRQRAETELDPFIKFFILYMCLDAWMSSGANTDIDSEKRKWLLQSDGVIRQHWNTPRTKEALEALKKINGVEDMRPGRKGNITYLHDVQNISNVTEFIYVIRCNLFHGGKSVVNINDRKLCESSAEILTDWIEHILCL